MPFRDNVDFCCLALNGPRLEPRGTTVLLPDLSVSDSADHVDLDFWAQWLGTIQSDLFRRSSLVITAEYRGIDAGANYQTRERIERRVRLLHWAFVLLGCGYNSSMLMVGGNTAGGHLHLGPISIGQTPCKQPQYRRARRTTAQDLAHAATILVSLEHVYGHAPGTDYRRIRKGFNSWVRGVQSDDPAEGLHSFVRASEAIIRPTATTRNRAITRTFVERGQTFTGRSKTNERLLRQFYELRSCIEHVKNVEPAIHKPRNIERDEAFVYRALQTEIFASSIYSRIFTNDALREQMRTETRVEAFWRRRQERRSALWGRNINLRAATNREFMSRHPAFDLL